mgnify:FL=1
MNGKLTDNFNKYLPRHQGVYIVACALAIIAIVAIIGFIFSAEVTGTYILIRDEILLKLSLGFVPVAIWISIFIATLYKSRAIVKVRDVVIWVSLLFAVIAALSILSAFQPGFDSNLRIFTLDGKVSLGGEVGSLITNDNLIIAIFLTIVMISCSIGVLFPKNSYYLLSKIAINSWNMTCVSIALCYELSGSILKLSKITFGKLQSFLLHYRNESHSLKNEPTSYVMEQEAEFESDSAALTSDYMSDEVIGEPTVDVPPEILEHTNDTVTESLASPQEQASKFNKSWNEANEDESRLQQTLSVEGLPLLDKWGKLWARPQRTILVDTPSQTVPASEMAETSKKIQQTLNDYGVEVEVKMTRPGPTVTMYGIEPGWIRRYKQESAIDRLGKPILDDSGKIVKKKVESKTRVKVDTIMQREKDLALALQTSSIRIESPVLGTSLVGIEVPNSNPSLVTIRSVMDNSNFGNLKKSGALPIALGKGTGGDDIVLDLIDMPHLLVAGATGSGKSVCLNTIVSCLISENSPSELRLLLIDPKRVELTPFNGIPHLLTPVTVETTKVVPLLKALINEMLKRYKHMEQSGVRNIASYNSKSREKMPYLVVVIDELADLMMTSSIDVEQSLCRLAQLGRATGIHLIIATQRPSVDVLTGLIKANFPSRIAFGVTSQIDSRTILDGNGAEKLLGRGDMLYQPIDAPRPSRVQGVFISDSEISKLVDYWKNVNWPPIPDMDLNLTLDSDKSEGSDVSEAGDELLDKAIALANSERKLSTSFLQRRLRIGYPRAARLMDDLEEQGVVGPSDGSKSRDVIIR